jgi:undecaprenyl-diphosphatase
MIVESEDRIDRVVLRYISRHLIHHRYNNLVKFITFFASVFFLVAASLAVFIFFITRKNWKRVIEFATISIGGFVLTTIMKYSFHRDRPLKPLITGANNFSFPSGHALSGFIFYGFLAYLAWKSGLPKKIKYLLSFFLIFFSFLIDLSRLYLRVHYPSDVISGVLIGFVWLLGVIWLIEKWEARGIKKSAA